jgi:hypothetical protein
MKQNLPSLHQNTSLYHQHSFQSSIINQSHPTQGNKNSKKTKEIMNAKVRLAETHEVPPEWENKVEQVI